MLGNMLRHSARVSPLRRIGSTSLRSQVVIRARHYTTTPESKKPEETSNSSPNPTTPISNPTTSGPTSATATPTPNPTNPNPTLNQGVKPSEAGKARQENKSTGSEKPKSRAIWPYVGALALVGFGAAYAFSPEVKSTTDSIVAQAVKLAKGTPAPAPAPEKRKAVDNHVIPTITLPTPIEKIEIIPPAAEIASVITVPLDEDPLPIEIVPADEVVSVTEEIISLIDSPVEAAPAVVKVDFIEIDPVPVESSTAADFPVAVLPLILDPNSVTIEGVILTDEPVVTLEELSAVDTSTPETLIREIVEEFYDRPTVPAVVVPSIDFEAILKEQSAQLEDLKTKLSQFQTDQVKSVDYQTTQTEANEKAYREVLALHDRIHRKELADKLAQQRHELEQKIAQLNAQHEKKLAQITTDLTARYQAQLQEDHQQTLASYQQQLEQAKAEIQRNMENSLSTAVENNEAQYSVRLAEEINRFDSQLATEITIEEAKYAASHNERMKSIDKLKSELSLLEAAFIVNAAKLKESQNLHHVHAAVYDLSSALNATTRISFVNELDKLEAASKLLGSDPVVGTIAEVLRPISAGGITPYNELVDRFKTVVSSGRQAALVPEGAGMMGNLVAAVASKLIIPAKGPVAGDSAEAILAKAEYYLENGELNEAVTQLSQLRGMPASIARDWLQAASDRLVVENSVKALHSHILVLTHQQQVSATDKK